MLGGDYVGGYKRASGLSRGDVDGVRAYRLIEGYLRRE